jgi:hypothetical protein
MINNEPRYNPINRYCLFGRKTEVPVSDDNYSKNFGFEQGEELMNELNDFEGISPELARNMQAELTQALRGSESILVVGTEGERTITIILAPRAVVGSRGPVLVPTSDKGRIVSMVSREFVEKCSVVCENMEDQDGAQEKWEKLLEFFFEKTVELADNDISATLEIPDFIPEEGI